MLTLMALESPNKISSLREYLSVVKNDRYLLLIIVVSLFFSSLFSYLSIMRYLSLNSTAYDLGVYSQVLNSTLHGKLFYTNLLGESLLSEHFSLLLFPMVIPYLLYQSPMTLLAIQGFVIGLATIPLYLMSKEWIALVNKDKNIGPRFLNLIPFSLGISYLLSPLVSGPISFDFHLMVFLPLFIFSAFYYFLKKKKLQHAIFLFLIVSIHSSFVFIVIFLLISEFLIYRNPKYGFREVQVKLFSRESLKYFLYFLLIVFVAGIYYYSVAYFKPIISGFPPNISGPYSGQSGSISDSTLGLIKALFTQPNVAISYLFANGLYKVVFLALAFSATGFVALLFPELLVSAIPYFLYGMFSTYSAYYTAGFQYSMMIIPFIFVASAGVGAKIFGMKFVSFNKYGGLYKRSVAVTLAMIILLAGLGGVFLTPFSPPSLFKNPGSVTNMWVYHPDAKSRFAMNISNDVPPGAFLLTQNDVFPVFSSDINAYSTPWSPGYSQSNVNKFQFYMASYGSTWVYASTGSSPSLFDMVNAALKTGNYGIYAEGYGILTIDRNYTGAPIYFTPAVLTMGGSELVTIGNNSSHSNGGISASDVGNNSSFFTSHRLTLLPGNYTLKLEYSTNSTNPNNHFLFNITSIFSKIDFVSKEVIPSESGKLNGTYTEYYSFNTGIVYNDIVLSGSELNWNGTVTVQAITISENSA